MHLNINTTSKSRLNIHLHKCINFIFSVDLALLALVVPTWSIIGSDIQHFQFQCFYL